MLFQPVFVFDGKSPSGFVEVAKAKGFRMVDIHAVGASVHGGNPGLVVYDAGTPNSMWYESEYRRFLPPKHTGVLVIFNSTKGHIRKLPATVEVVEWFFGKKVRSFNGITGKFRLEN